VPGLFQVLGERAFTAEDAESAEKIEKGKLSYLPSFTSASSALPAVKVFPNVWLAPSPAPAAGFYAIMKAEP
jgi:hypothetical protein